MVAVPIGVSLEAAEFECRWQELVGTWYDFDLKRARCSAYTVSLNEAGDGFDVCTYRSWGKIIQSANLIRFDEDSSCLTWGRRGGAHVFVAVEVSESSIIWSRGTTEFRWSRAENGFWGNEANPYWMQEEELKEQEVQYSYEDDCRRGRGRCQVVPAQSRDRSRSRGRVVPEECPTPVRTVFLENNTRRISRVYPKTTMERPPIGVARLKTNSWVNTLAVSLLFRAKQNIDEELKASRGRSSMFSTEEDACHADIKPNEEDVFHADIEPLDFNKEPDHFYASLMETPRPAADPFYESLVETPRPPADPFYESLMETPRPKEGKVTTSQQAQKRLRSTCEPIPAGARKTTRVSSSGKKPLVASKLKTSLTPRSAVDVGGGKKPAVVSKLKASLTPRNAPDVGGSDSYSDYTEYDEDSEEEYSEDEYSDNSSGKDDFAPGPLGRNRKGKGWEWPMTNVEKKNAAQQHTKNLETIDPQELFDEISKLEENLRGKKMSVKELEACAKKTHALQTMLEQHESMGKHKHRKSCSF